MKKINYKGRCEKTDMDISQKITSLLTIKSTPGEAERAMHSRCLAFLIFRRKS